MKLLATIILAVSLSLGALSAATGYLAPLTAPDEQLLGLIIAADIADIASADDEITPDLLERLRAAGGDGSGATTDLEPIRFVPVRSFSSARWPGKWWFMLSLAGLCVAGVMLRIVTRQAGQQSAAVPGASPEEALQSIQEVVESLRVDLPTMLDDQIRLHEIVRRLGVVQKEHVVAFADSRTNLRSRLGTAGFAMLMDRFAAAERQINRAWSASADNVLEEAVICLDEAAQRLAETQERMPGAEIEAQLSAEGS